MSEPNERAESAERARAIIERALKNAIEEFLDYNAIDADRTKLHNLCFVLRDGSALNIPIWLGKGILVR
jgi:hypothetical protein